MRAKFRCNTVKFSGDPTDPNSSRTYELGAVYDNSTKENERFAKATPMGQLTITIDNPAAKLEPGKEYYLDFTPCTPTEAAAWRGEDMGNTHPVGVDERYQPAHADDAATTEPRTTPSGQPIDTIDASGHTVRPEASER